MVVLYFNKMVGCNFIKRALLIKFFPWKFKNFRNNVEALVKIIIKSQLWKVDNVLGKIPQLSGKANTILLRCLFFTN